MESSISRLSQADFLNELSKCGTNNLRCNWRTIGKSRDISIRKAYGFDLSPYATPKDLISSEDVEKAIDKVYKYLNRKGSIPTGSPANIYLILQKPAFKALHILDDCMKKYWGTIDFIRWSSSILSTFETSVNHYVASTGLFDQSKSYTVFTNLDDTEAKTAMQDLVVASQILVNFDRDLLIDFGVLLCAISDGINQIATSPNMFNPLSRVMLLQMRSDINDLSFDFSGRFLKLRKSLNEHGASWNKVRYFSSISWENLLPKSVITDLNNKLRFMNEVIERKTNAKR